MSRKTQRAAAILAASLLAGSVAVAASAAPRQRPIDLDSGRPVLVQMFDWVRTLLAGRRDGSQPATHRSSVPQKEGGTPDPNGGK
jgi:hypothetical protein